MRKLILLTIIFLVFYKCYGKSLSQSKPIENHEKLLAHELARREASHHQEGALISMSLTTGTELHLTTENTTSISKAKERELSRAVFRDSENPEILSHTEKAASDLTPDTQRHDGAQHVLGGRKGMDPEGTSIPLHTNTGVKQSVEDKNFDHRTLPPTPVPQYFDGKPQEQRSIPEAEGKYSAPMAFPLTQGLEYHDTQGQHSGASHTEKADFGPIALPQTQGSESTAKKDGQSAGQPENSPPSPTGRQIRPLTGGPGQQSRMTPRGPDGQQNVRSPSQGGQSSQPPRGSQGQPSGLWDQKPPPNHGNQQGNTEGLPPNQMSQQGLPPPDPKNQHGSNRRDPPERSDRPIGPLAQRGPGSFDSGTGTLDSTGGPVIDLAGATLLNSNIGNTTGDHVSDGLGLMAEHQTRTNQQRGPERGSSWSQGDWSGRDPSSSGLAPRRPSDYPITGNGSSSGKIEMMDFGPQRGSSRGGPDPVAGLALIGDRRDMLSDHMDTVADFHSGQYDTQMGARFNSRDMSIGPSNRDSHDKRFPNNQNFAPSNGRDTLYPPNQNFRTSVQYGPHMGIGGDIEGYMGGYMEEKGPRYACQNANDPLCMYNQKKGYEMDIKTGNSEMDIEGDEMDIEGPDALNLLTSLGMSPNTTNQHALDINIKHNVLKILRERFNVTSPQDMVKPSEDPLFKQFMFNVLSRSSKVAPGEYKANLTAKEAEQLLANGVSIVPPSPPKTEGGATQAKLLSGNKGIVPFNEGPLQPKAERLVDNPSEENETAEIPAGPIMGTNLTNGLGKGEAESNAHETEHPVITEERSEAGEETGTSEKGEATGATKSVPQVGSASSNVKGKTEQPLSNSNNPDTSGTGSDPNNQQASGSGTNGNSGSGTGSTSQSGSGSQAGTNSGQDQVNKVPAPESKDKVSAGMIFGIIVAVLLGMGIIIGPILCLLCKWWTEAKKKKRKEAALKNRDFSCTQIYDDMVLNDLGPDIPLTVTNEKAYPYGASGHNKSYTDMETNTPESKLLQSGRTDPRGRLP